MDGYHMVYGLNLADTFEQKPIKNVEKRELERFQRLPKFFGYPVPTADCRDRATGYLVVGGGPWGSWERKWVCKGTEPLCTQQLSMKKKNKAGYKQTWRVESC